MIMYLIADYLINIIPMSFEIKFPCKYCMDCTICILWQ